MTKPEELERISERLEMATRAAKIAVWEWDYKTDSLYWSPVFLDILGLQQEDFKGQFSDFMDRLVPEHRGHVERTLEAHFVEGKPYDIEFEMVHKDGHRVALTATGKATFDPDGTPTRMVGTVQDITERQTLEEKLLRAERIGKIGHWELDIVENRLSWSPETFRIHGLDPSDQQPSVEEAFQFYHPDDIGMVSKNFEEVFETGQLRAVNARLVIRSGEIRYVNADGIANASDEAGRPIRVFGILHDRTEFVKQQEQLQQSQRLDAIGQLAGGIAHDFNNLLAVIYGNLEMLEEYEKTPNIVDEDRLGAITSAMAAARSGAELTKNMLTFASKSHLAPQLVSVNDLIKETESWLVRIVPSTIKVEVNLSASPDICKLDPAGFQSALVNVVVNARDAMPDGGRLTIETRIVDMTGEEAFALQDATLQSTQFVKVAVQDTGTGIPTDLLVRVFEPFVSTKEMSTGRGLGLSMVQGYARQSNGYVKIESEVDIGTRVELFFPLTSMEAAIQFRRETDDVDYTAPKKRTRILVAEDQPEVLALLVRMLKSVGYDIEAAANGHDAWDLFNNAGPFDLLLTDVVMPGDLSGPKLAARCREVAKDLPVVFLTGYSSNIVVQNDDLNSHDIRLMKPVPKSELLAAVNELLLD